MRQVEEALQSVLILMLLALVGGMLIWCTTDCAGATPAAKGAECAAIRQFFDDAQTKLIASGACDQAKAVSMCPPHIALREAFVASLERNQCPSKAP